MNQDDLAGAIPGEYTRAHISQYETGRTMPPALVLKAIAGKLLCTVDALLAGDAGADLSQPILPGMSIDDRINALPEGLREFVLKALQAAERAAMVIPSNFLKPPTSDNWPEYASYLDSITLVNVEKDKP